MKIYTLLIFILVSGCNLWETVEEEEIPTIPGKLVFSAQDENNNYQIYTSLTNGTKLRKLTNFKNDAGFQPSWSNDGKRIAFSTTLNATTSGSSLYLMNADGSNLRPLKERPNTDVPTAGNNPVWSPDDSKIAFDFCNNCEGGGNNYDIYVYDFHSDGVIQLTDTISSDAHPKWINNNNIYFISDRDYFLTDSLLNNEDIYAINITNRSISQISHTGKIGSLTFNTATNSILVRPERGSDSWYFLNIATSDSTLFNFPNTISRRFTSAVKWSENGEWILFRIGGIKDGAFFTFYNIETETIVQFNDEAFKDRGIDWFYKE